MDIPYYAPPPKKVHITIEILREGKSGKNMAKNISVSAQLDQDLYTSALG